MAKDIDLYRFSDIQKTRAAVVFLGGGDLVSIAAVLNSSAATTERWLTTADFSRFLQRELQNRVATKGAAAAYAFMEKTLLDEQTPLDIRFKIAKDLLDRAGVGIKAGKDAANTLNLADMSRDELNALLDGARKEIAQLDHAQGVVDAQPQTPDSDKPLSMLD